MEKNNLNKKISECISEKMNYSGISLEFSTKLIEEIKRDAFIENIEEYIKEDDLRTYIHCTYMDNNMILYVLQRMLMDGEAEVVFTDKATDKDINYIKKLAKFDFDTPRNSTTDKKEMCHEEKEDLETFKAMLNSGIQRLSLEKEEVIKLLDELYK